MKSFPLIVVIALASIASGCASLRTIDETQVHFRDANGVREVPCDTPMADTQDLSGAMPTSYIDKFDPHEELRAGSLVFDAKALKLAALAPLHNGGSLRLQLEWISNPMLYHTTCLLTPWSNVTGIDEIKHASKGWAWMFLVFGPAAIAAGVNAEKNAAQCCSGFGVSFLALGSAMTLTALPYVLTRDQVTTVWPPPPSR